MVVNGALQDFGSLSTTTAVHGRGRPRDRDLHRAAGARRPVASSVHRPHHASSSRPVGTQSARRRPSDVAPTSAWSVAGHQHARSRRSRSFTYAPSTRHHDRDQRAPSTRAASYPVPGSRIVQLRVGLGRRRPPTTSTPARRKITTIGWRRRLLGHADGHRRPRAQRGQHHRRPLAGRAVDRRSP